MPPTRAVTVGCRVTGTTLQLCARGTAPAYRLFCISQYEPRKGEIEDMIWEVDETLDSFISYQEFNLMYRRIRQTDPMGLEPRKLFVVCDYMMNDKNGDGGESCSFCLDSLEPGFQDTSEALIDSSSCGHG